MDTIKMNIFLKSVQGDFMNRNSTLIEFALHYHRKFSSSKISCENTPVKCECYEKIPSEDLGCVRDSHYHPRTLLILKNRQQTSRREFSLERPQIEVTICGKLLQIDPYTA